MLTLDHITWAFYGAASLAGFALLVFAVLSLIKSIRRRRLSAWERSLRKVTKREHRAFTDRSGSEQ